ncbi:hypothetical protein K458DRAFT_391852 [Lentithecium fluviatile CBS 122367]|uniref:Uncharacterized protein n=1 Tax=Lentithecium fluviatile CBS 122367 TaxID=1168545 RepID=A0A6G1IT93_9PLEO|nr:hypothetical protein K458DRAFT_391852 [Lentithecium fluviatile CBS 122367]
MDRADEEAFDITRYRFERAFRKSESGKEGHDHDFGSEPGKEDPQSPEAANRSSSISGSDLSPSQRRKGILKKPTVRFKEDHDVGMEPHFPPPMFPPPPPPNGQPFLGGQPVLYDQMLPLPPGPPTGLNLFVAGPDGTPRIDRAAEALYTKFMDELDEFVTMQGNVIKARVHVQERRTRLRLYRENVSRRDIDYMDYLRECKAKGTVADDPKLEELFEAAITARDEVGPEEMEYEALEIKLGAEEFALKEKYDSLENRFAHFFKLRPGSTTNNSVPETIEFEPPSATSDSGERQKADLEPRQYSLFQGAFIGDQVKVGQLPLAGNDAGPGESAADAPTPPTNEGPHSGPQLSSEAHGPGLPIVSVLSNHAVDESPQAVTERFSADSDGVETFWSENAPEFESGESRMRFSLQGLSLPPIDEGVESYLDDLDVDYSFGDDDVDSLLLLGTDSDTHSTLSDYLISFESTRNRVNRWLLHKLRVSPLEVFELRRQVLESNHLVPDWANLALDVWETDMTDNKLRPDTSPAPYPSTRDLPKRHRWRKKRGPHIALPETDALLAFDPATRHYIQIPM